MHVYTNLIFKGNSHLQNSEQAVEELLVHSNLVDAACTGRPAMHHLLRKDAVCVVLMMSVAACLDEGKVKKQWPKHLLAVVLLCAQIV